MAPANVAEKSLAFQYHAAMRKIDVISVSDKPPARLGRLARLGRAVRRNQKAVAVIQWTVVVLYLSLLLIPLFLPAPGKDARLLDDFGLLSRFLLWGVGWPLIMLSMMLLGRVWCGLFCPDGTLTEFVSRRGQNRYIPRWMRWRGWPFAMLAATTLYGQMVGVYSFAPATFLLLGLPTFGAILTGYLYGRGRRVWCMYLCPANAAFSLLAKVSPLHFRVDQDAWKRHPGPPQRVECAPLINIRQMKSASACHACGRCAGHMDAVDLAARSPAHEILAAGEKEVTTAEALTLIFGLIGICTAALLWQGNALFLYLQNLLTEWLPGVNSLQIGAPWWLLANYPEAGIVYTLLDGLSILVFIVIGGALLGLAVMAALMLAARLSGGKPAWQNLALALIPAAGCGMVIGLSSLTIVFLRTEGLLLSWASLAQALALSAGCLFSLWLGMRLIVASPIPNPARRMAALAFYALPVALIHYLWSAGILQ